MVAQQEMVLWTIRVVVLKKWSQTNSITWELVRNTNFPLTWIRNSGRGAQRSVLWKPCRWWLVHYIGSLVLATDLKKRNCLSGSCAAQSVTEVRVQLCKDSATEDYRAATPGREALCFVLSLAERQGPCKLKVDGWRGEKLTGSDIYIFLFCYHD